MSGASLRLGRLFDRASGRSFIAAIDHGITLGVPEGAEDALGAIERVIRCEPDAVLISPGMLARGSDLFAYRSAPAPIVRADFIVNHPFVDDLGEHYRVLCTPAHAANLGANAFIMFLILGPEPGQMFADNIKAIATASEEAHKLGLPLIIEAVAWGRRAKAAGMGKDAELLAFGCRIAAELGADAVKTEYPGSQEGMATIVDGCPVPVLVLGGPKTDDPAGLITATRDAMSAGARGVVYGRNVWQADDPPAISRQIREVIHGPMVPATA